MVVKKPKTTFLASLSATLVEMMPANASAETEDLHRGGWAIPIALIKQIAFVVVLLVYAFAIALCSTALSWVGFLRTKTPSPTLLV